MKKYSVMIVTVIVMLLLASGCKAYEEPFRLHIIANSNTAADQQIKLEVRDAVLKLVKEDFAAIDNEKQAQKYVTSHIEEIEACANSVLKENGCDYTAEAQIGVFEFPDRTYGNVTYPAGDYYAMRLVLGEGSVETWWCVMFPPLCVINTQEAPEDVEYRSFLLDWISAIFGVDNSSV